MSWVIADQCSQCYAVAVLKHNINPPFPLEVLDRNFIEGAELASADYFHMTLLTVFSLECKLKLGLVWV